MQNIDLSKKYLSRIISDIYLDINLLSQMPASAHTKSVINHIKDRVRLLDSFVALLHQYYEEELNINDAEDIPQDSAQAVIDSDFEHIL